MKRKIITVLLVSFCMCIGGCDKKAVDKVDVQTKMNGETSRQQENTESDGSRKYGRSDVAEGVYLNAGSIVEVKMGTCIDGVQTDFCKVKMPTSYLFGAGYTNEEGQELSVQDTGSISLEEILDREVLESSGKAITDVVITSFESDRSELTFYVAKPEMDTLESMKEYNPNGKELGTPVHPAYYHEDTSEYALSDMSLGYQINDSLLLVMTYKGPLFDDLGIDQLAENMYNLVEVID